MSSYYHVLYSGGDSCADNRRMYIRLYPNTDTELPNVKKGTETTTTLRDAAESLLNANAINYYEIKRFHAEDYNYLNKTDIDSSSSSGISVDFEDYLRGCTDGTDSSSCGDLYDSETNGTGENLKVYRGSHVLIHGAGIDTDKASAEYGHDDCATDHNDPEPKADDDGGSAFSRGVMAWASVPSKCNDASKGRNAVIQEPLHTFIRANNPNVKSMMADTDGDGKDYYEEHTLGRLLNSKASPMLTFHVNEHSHYGECSASEFMTHDGGYTTQLSQCTKDAVWYTALDQCNSQFSC